jgi:hypothetical protein
MYLDFCVDLFDFSVDLLEVCVDLFTQKVNAKIQMRWAFFDIDTDYTEGHGF